MQWIIDHLAAFVIGCTVVMLLAVLQLRSQDAVIESTQFNAARTAAMLLTEVLEQDIANIGAGQLSKIGAVISLDTTETVKSFRFRTLIDRNNATPSDVEYRWRQDGEVTLRNKTVPRYSVSRVVGTTEFPLSGNVVTSFRVHLLDHSLDTIKVNTLTALSATRRIDVGLTLVSPLGTGELVEETRWERQIIPINMRRQEGSVLLQWSAL
jgi:hypothetical protein